jgi:S1-C subfamily serine protease
VREGGPAEAAGIEEGDVIIALKGIPTPDIETYTEVLDEQIIGRTVSVKVKKGEAEVDLQVKVGSRSGM